MERNLRFKLDWASLTVGRTFTAFALFTLHLTSNFQVQATGGLYLEGRLNGGFFVLRVWGAYINLEGLIHETTCFRNFTVYCNGMYRSLLASPARTCPVIDYIKIGSKLLRHFH